MCAAFSLRWLTVGIVSFIGSVVGLDGQPAPVRQPSRPSLQLSGAPSQMPMIGSALAVTPDSVYAIAQDQRRVIVRPADLSEPWRALDFAGAFTRVGGLAAQPGGLFVTDSADGAVYRIDLRTRERAAIYRDGPLRSPGSIAVARDVFVADDSTFKLYRIRDDQAREIALDKEVGKDRPLSLAGSGDDLLVSSPDGLISEFRGLGRADPEQSQSPRQQSSQIYRDKRSLEPLVFTLQRRAFPDIEQPTDIAMWKGVVYIVDAGHKSVFAFSRHDQRPVRLSRGPRARIANPTSLAVNEQALFVLNGNELQRWPRLIPAEVHLRITSVSEAMSLVYDYLRDRNILPVRQVRLEQNVEHTLKKNRVILAGYPASLTSLLCLLNAGLCDKSGKIKPLQPGEPLWVPDLYSENYVDAIPVTLNGRESLGQVADRRVTSEEFAGWKSEERLKELNESQLARAKVGAARDVRSGEYMTPVEYIRYLVPAVAGDASGSGPLKKLEGVFEGLKVVPLDERAPTSASGSEPTQQEPDLKALKLQFEAMLSRIDYFSPLTTPIPTKVGVAEEFIDTSHPDLQNALMRQDGVQPVPAALPPASGVKYQIRSFQKPDHGTMVAGLIAARETGFEHRGLAPKAMLLSLRSPDPAIGEDIRRAMLRGIRLFNISAHYNLNVIPASLLAAIDQYPKALFIVAAGNDLVMGSNEEVCRTFLVYPACWHDKKNVLVVTATTSEGTAVLPPAGVGQLGANWSGKAVHLAAPGEGYHAPAIGSSYAPVRGSSFATPLVTATAALIYAQSVTEPEPWTIKQRLIATADPQTGLAGRVVSGRLNVRRALSDLGLGVLTRQVRGPDNTSKTEVERIVIDAGQITVRQADGEDRIIAVRKLRRVHQYGHGYRIVYVDRDTLDVLEGASFTTEQNAQFEATREGGGMIMVNLLEWMDFVAPL